MAWGWLKAMSQGATEGAIEEAVKEIKTPDTMEDAATPEAVKKGWTQFIREKLKRKPTDSGE